MSRPALDRAVARDAAAFSGYYETARHGLLKLLDGSVAPRRVLEIGCGAGANLAEIKCRYPGVETAGVELHPAAADAARVSGRADTLLLADVLDFDAVRFDESSFDLIILSHVLEHFAQPEQVIDRSKHWLQSDGRMLIALPNVRHATVVKKLLIDGDFRYQDAGGILDSTHLRFFTRSSAIRFIESQGLQVLGVAADIEGRRSRLLDKFSLGLAREFAAFAYNFLVAKA